MSDKPNHIRCTIPDCPGCEVLNVRMEALLVLVLATVRTGHTNPKVRGWAEQAVLLLAEKSPGMPIPPVDEIRGLVSDAVDRKDAALVKACAVLIPHADTRARTDELAQATGIIYAAMTIRMLEDFGANLGPINPEPEIN